VLQKYGGKSGVHANGDFTRATTINWYIDCSEQGNNGPTLGPRTVRRSEFEEIPDIRACVQPFVTHHSEYDVGLSAAGRIIEH
jgi:hypothetical protein